MRSEDPPYALQSMEPHDRRESRESHERLLGGSGDSEDTEDDEPPSVASAKAPDDDPFQQFDGLPPERSNILTVRAVAVGALCGSLINASNIYLGLKSGFATSANLFGSIVGFAVLKSCSTYFAHIPLLGGSFGPRENNIVQTTATAAGGMSGIFTAAFPALYQLGLLESPGQDFGRIMTLTVVGGYFGFFFATPLRKFFIIAVARELHLIFPSCSATAMTIKNMHLAAEGAKGAQQKMRVLLLAFGSACVLRVVSQYATGLLWDWHIFTWLFLLSVAPDASMAFESWGWFLEWTPAFLGTGLLVGLNVAFSYMLGVVLAWGVIGPYIVRNGIAFGTHASEDERWSAFMSYQSLTPQYASATHPSPRYWLLWPGLLCMIAVSLTELACQWRIFWLTGTIAWRKAQNTLQLLRLALRGKWTSSSGSTNDDEEGIKDVATPDELVPTRMWLPGLGVTVVLTCIILKRQYGMPVAETLLSLVLAFFFAFVAIQSTGATDITPIVAVSKSSQIILGAQTRDWPLADAQRMNLLGGALAGAGASQAADLVGDFRVGYLLRTSPRLQWYAQGIGTLLAITIAPAVFVLFATAYPCILDATAPTCAFPAPAVASWRAVAVAATDPEVPIPRSSAIFAVVFATVGCVAVLARHLFLRGRWEWLRGYQPNAMVIGLAFVLPATHFGSAMLIGALLAAWWKRRRPAEWEAFGYAVAAGFIAGEGIGGVVNSVLMVVGLSGEAYGTGVLCPAGIC